MSEMKKKGSSEGERGRERKAEKSPVIQAKNPKSSGSRGRGSAFHPRPPASLPRKEDGEDAAQR